MQRFLLYFNSSLIKFGIVSLLSSKYPSANIIEASSTTQLYEKLQSSKYDLLIIELGFINISLQELLQSIFSKKRHQKILVTSFIPEKYFAVMAYKMGVKGIFHCSQPTSSLLEAIEIVLNDSIYYNTEVKRILKISDSEKPREAIRFSKNQKKILSSLLLGYDEKKIAEELDLTIMSVRNSKNEILRKFTLLQPKNRHLMEKK